MATYKVDAEIDLGDVVSGEISVCFDALGIESALEMAKELLGDIIVKDNTVSIFRIDELIAEDDDGE